MAALLVVFVPFLPFPVLDPLPEALLEELPDADAFAVPDADAEFEFEEVPLAEAESDPDVVALAVLETEEEESLLVVFVGFSDVVELESALLTRSPSIPSIDGGHGHAADMDVKMRRVERMWIRLNAFMLVSLTLND